MVYRPRLCACARDRVHTRFDKGRFPVKIGASLFVFAVGAILTFAVDWSPSGIDLGTVGIILMIVGGVLFLLSLIILATRANRGEPLEPGGIVEERRIYNDDPLP
jgi:uncharacterized protein DUF6458